MRLVSWNIESLAPWLGSTPRHDLRARVAELGKPDVLLLQEIKLRPHDVALVEQMHAALPGYTCHAALCDDPRNATFRGGRAYGVATYVRDTLGRSVGRSPAWDREGRVVVTAVAGVTIVNLYAVNGTAKPYFDPDSGEHFGNRHTFKRRFQAKVFELVAELRELGGVIVGGDWNVTQAVIDTHPRLRTEAPHATVRAELAAHRIRTGLVDVFRALHPERRAYTWYAHKLALDAARVDYFLVSPDLAPRVKAAEIEPRPTGQSGSDHAAITIEL